MRIATGRVNSARNGGPAPPLSGVSKRCSIFEGVLLLLSLLMLSRRRRCEGCDASQHALHHLLLAPQLVHMPLLPRPLAPSAVINMMAQHEGASAMPLLIGMPSRRRPALRACMDVKCGHLRIPPRRRSLTALLHRGRARALAGAAGVAVAACPLADPLLPHTPVLQQPAKALRRRESLGHLPLVIPWSLSASRATPLAITTSRPPPPSPSPLVPPVLRRDRRSSSLRSRLCGYMYDT